jgi:hypothetical protein
MLHSLLFIGGPSVSSAASHHRKIDDNPVDEDLRSALKAFCTHLAGAMNKYYSFGSVFAEDI